MKNTVFLINADFTDAVAKMLKSNDIPFHIGGFPDGKVTVIEQYESKINSIPPDKPKKKYKSRGSVSPKEVEEEHLKLREFAKHLGCKDIPSAISKVGGGKRFRQRFIEEYAG